MKKTIKVFGIIAIVAMIGFSMAACSDKGADYSYDPDNLFKGVWTDGELTVKCSDDTWSASVPGAGSWKGSYTSNGSTATFIETDGSNFGTATISTSDIMTVKSTYGTFYLGRK